MEATAFLPIVVFGAGLLSFFAPCIVPLLPVYVGFLSKGASESIDSASSDKPEKKEGNKSKAHFTNSDIYYWAFNSFYNIRFWSRSIG